MDGRARVLGVWGGQHASGTHSRVPGTPGAPVHAMLPTTAQACVIGSTPVLRGMLLAIRCAVCGVRVRITSQCGPLLGLGIRKSQAATLPTCFGVMLPWQLDVTKRVNPQVLHVHF